MFMDYPLSSHIVPHRCPNKFPQKKNGTVAKPQGDAAQQVVLALQGFSCHGNGAIGRSHR